MNPQRSEKNKEPGRSQTGFERSRKRGSSAPHGQEHHRPEGPDVQHEQPDDEFDEEK
ncbi:MAG TPA: hypothetical protein VKH82_07055 [Candidatus Binatia bacterium]|nr:hypothetical protein [Candidatus Binatia bacterium]